MNALNLRQVEQKTAWRKSSIYPAIAEGKFPAPAKVGRRSIWDEAEIDAWLAARFAERTSRKAAA